MKKFVSCLERVREQATLWWSDRAVFVHASQTALACYFLFTNHSQLLVCLVTALDGVVKANVLRTAVVSGALEHEMLWWGRLS